MENSLLIQRLREPISKKDKNGDLIQAFAFGGGYVNGGIPKEAMKLLAPIFSFDYMGAAEYEWGAVPESLNSMVQNMGSYLAWTLNINNTPIYIFGPERLQKEINDRLHLLATDEHARYDVKCGCDLYEAVGLNKNHPKEKCRTIGWLELDNHFAFFIKRETWEAFCKLFNKNTN